MMFAQAVRPETFAYMCAAACAAYVGTRAFLRWYRHAIDAEIRRMVAGNVPMGADPFATYGNKVRYIQHKYKFHYWERDRADDPYR